MMMTDLNSSRVSSASALDKWRGFSLPAASGAASSRRRAGSVTFTARHEAGHAVAAIACGLSIDGATIDPATAGPGRAGCIWARPDCNKIKPLAEFSQAPLLELVPRCADDFTAEEIVLTNKLRTGLYAQAICALAGKESDRLFSSDRPSVNYGSDMQLAAECTKLIATDLEAAMALIDFARKDAVRILIANASKVEAIAAALIEHKTLDGAEIAAILAGRSLQRKQWTATGAELFLSMTGGLKLLPV